MQLRGNTCGRPDVPTDEVVEDEGHKHHCRPAVVGRVRHICGWHAVVVVTVQTIYIRVQFITVWIPPAPDQEVDNQGNVRVDVNGGQGNVEHAENDGFLDLPTCLERCICEGKRIF